jgi:predicted porin
VMGNTGGDNRVEFGTRLDHSIWYESPRMQGFSFDLLYSPGQNRTVDNVIQSAGSSDCNGGNMPGSGNLPLNCDDGGFDSAYSLDLKFETKQLYITAAYELHKNVNRNSDGIGSNNPLYGVDPTTLDPAYLPGGAIVTGFPGAWAVFSADGGTPPFLNDIGDEAAFKFGVQYIFDFGMTVSGIFERMTRSIPANLQYQNERQRNGVWVAATQEINPANNVSIGWAHAGKTPGDPGGQHNYDPNSTNDTADMFTLAYKHRLDNQLYWYVDLAETINHGNAHYDLGAGGRGITTDCHDGTNTVMVDYSSAGPTTWGGCRPKGISVGMNYKF